MDKSIDSWADVFAALFSIAIIAGFIFCIPYSVTKLAKRSCEKRAEIYNVEHAFDWTIGCFVKHDGRYIRIREYENIIKNAD